MRRYKIYLAAPFFSQGERQFNEIVLRELEAKWEVFYPYRDGLRMAELVAGGAAPVDAASRVWRCDFEQIKASDLIVAVLDGRVPDEGVCVELGLARGLDKPVVGVSTDSRGCFSWGANPMVTSCLQVLCDNVLSLAALVEQHEARRSAQHATTYGGG